MNAIAQRARAAAISCEAKNAVPVGHGVGAVAIVWLDADIAVVDVSDVPTIAPYSWSVTRGKSGPKYARAYIGGGRKSQKQVRMHRLLLSAKRGQEVDHINGDGLDNRRSNLRIVTRSENLMNAGAFKSSKSGIRGVCWYPKYRKWRAYIHVAGKMQTLGYFSDQGEAICARKAAEEKFFPGVNRSRP